jgi:hypothetical protein
MVGDPWGANASSNRLNQAGANSVQIYAKVTPEREKDVMSGSHSPNPSLKGGNTPRENINPHHDLFKGVS